MWYLFNMSADLNLSYPASFSSPTSRFIQILTGYLPSIIIKAYSMGPLLCHTTNILSC